MCIIEYKYKITILLTTCSDREHQMVMMTTFWDLYERVHLILILLSDNATTAASSTMLYYIISYIIYHIQYFKNRI